MERTGRVRVLIVEDSALMRKLLADLLGSAPEIEVVGIARDGLEAIEQAAILRPDVVTLDVQMPGMSGLETLPALLLIHEAPVVMVSSLTQEGADITLAALELGAVDYLPKPERFQLSEMRNLGPMLISKVLIAAQSRVRKHRKKRAPLVPPSSPQPKVAMHAQCGHTVVVIGISTGGPQTLSEIFPNLTPPTPPIVVVQHMPARFTGIFAQRLDRHCELTVKEAEHGDRVLNNQVLIAPGGRHISLSGHPPHVLVHITEGTPVSGHMPSIDVLFQSAAKSFGSGAVGILMTGMGRDGVEGCKAIMAVGGDTYAQDKDSSVVYGMNKAAFQEGAIKAQITPEEIPAIIRLLGRR